MRRFTSAAQLQRFASVHGIVQTLFRVGRHLLRSAHPRLLRTRAFVEWESHRVGQPWARACRGGSALSPREIDTPDRTQQAHVTASCRGTQPLCHQCEPREADGWSWRNGRDSTDYGQRTGCVTTPADDGG